MTQRSLRHPRPHSLQLGTRSIQRRKSRVAIPMEEHQLAAMPGVCAFSYDVPLSRSRIGKLFGAAVRGGVSQPQTEGASCRTSALMCCPRYGEPIYVDADGRNGQRVRIVADGDLIYFDLRRVAGAILCIQAAGHLPQSRWPSQTHTVNIEIELLLRLRCIYDGKS